MKVPKSDDYFPFIYNRRVFIMYANGNDMTYIKSNNYHRLLKNSYPSVVNDKDFRLSGSNTRVGNFIWIIGKFIKNYPLEYVRHSDLKT